jgi:hypothetical protein
MLIEYCNLFYGRREKSILIVNGGEWKIENENLISEIKEGKRIERQKKYC